MTKKERFFISVISDHLSRRKTVVPDSVDWNRLQILAVQQQLSPLVYAQCKEKLFEQAYLAAQFYYIKRLETVRQVEDILRANQIDFFIVKGPVVARYYPAPALRTMGDVDIVVHDGERNRVLELIKPSGFLPEGTLGEREWHIHYHEILLELHDHLVYDQAVSEDAHKAFFNKCWDYVRDNTLDPSFHFLFILLHLRKHFMNRGVGIRQFMDVAVMERQDLDWKWIEGKLRELDLWIFAERVLALNRHWFGIGPPICIHLADEEFCEEASDLILRNGVFGFENQENARNVAVNVANKEGTSLLVRSKRVFDAVFYSYEKMLLMDRYRYVRGRKYLMPIAWFHRAVHAVRLGRANKTMKTVVADAFVSQKKIEERNRLFEQWGL